MMLPKEILLYAIIMTIKNLESFSHVMFKDDSYTMHMQPSLPEISIHGEDGFPVGSKLGLKGVFGSTMLQ